MKTKYWVAKYIDDIFRDEAKNVGLFAEIDNKIFARFYGESTEDGTVDGRKVKGLYPDVYKQWIGFWRRKLKENDFTSILNHEGTHYKVLEGGEITGAEGDSPEDVMNYLYSLIVSEGGFKEAMGAEEEKTMSFIQDLENTFAQKKLLDEDGEIPFNHLIKKNVPISFMPNLPKIVFNPAFTQENGKVYLMDIADFTTQRKKIVRDHAGYLAYFYKNLRELNSSKYEPITLVRITDEDMEYEEVSSGLSLLKNEGRVIDWLNQEEKNKFIQEREEIARS